MNKKDIEDIVLKATQSEVAQENIATEVGLGTDLRACGLDSLNIVDIAVEVESDLGSLGHDVVFDYSESYVVPQDFVEAAYRQIGGCDE